MTSELPSPNQGVKFETLKNQTRELVRFTDSEEFLNELYKEVVLWLKEGNGQVIQEFDTQQINNWEQFPDYHKGPSSLSLNLKKACVIEDPKKTFFLTLGQGPRSEHFFRNSLRLQYGFSPAKSQKEQPSEYSLKDFKMFIFPHPLLLNTWAVGEIYADTNDNIGIISWVTDFPFGHEKFKNWKTEDVLSTNGINEALTVIQQQVERAYPEDLTSK